MIFFLSIDTPFFYLNATKSETNSELNFILTKSNNNFLNKKFKNSDFKNKDFTNSITNEFKKVLAADIIKFQNKLINQLAVNNQSNLDKFSLEIESDIQYEINNVYYAEGNVIIYFSNLILTGDKVEYDKSNKTLKVIGNVIFKKGNQYFEASQVFYNLKKNKGFIDNIYGILDMKSFVKDFEFKNIGKEYFLKNDENDLEDLQYIDDVNIGFINDFENNKNFNMSGLKFNIPSIKKWRYKSKKILLDDSKLISKEILFTNDALNKPQFILRSRKFTGENIDGKIKLISRKSTIILDDLLRVPIGKRTIYDKESVSSWGIGADYIYKDGFYLSKAFETIKIKENVNLNLRPYILLQRGLQGSTKAFREPKSSLLSQKKQNNDVLISDVFALDANLNADIYDFKLNLSTKLNTLNTKRSSEALRSKFTLSKSINLNTNNADFFKENVDETSRTNFVELKSNKEDNQYLEIENKEEESFDNFLDLKFTSSFRDTISKGYSGDQEIYFGNALSFANRKSWLKKNRKTDLVFIFDTGKFKAKSKKENKFDNLYRNVFASKLSYKFPIWYKPSIIKNIDSSYRYTPNIINEGLDWVTEIQTGVFLYSDGSSQKGLSFNNGPNFSIGKFKNKMLDYTNISLRHSYVLKSGESPFAFDDIGKSSRLSMNIKQQIYGPLVLSYETSINLDDGKYAKPNYRLDFKRRAYSIGAFYNTQNKIIGLNFNIFNFNYSGKSKKF